MKDIKGILPFFLKKIINDWASVAQSKEEREGALSIVFSPSCSLLDVVLPPAMAHASLQRPLSALSLPLPASLYPHGSFSLETRCLSPSTSMAAVMRSRLLGYRRQARARAWRPKHTKGAGASPFFHEMLPFEMEEARDSPR